MTHPHIRGGIPPHVVPPGIHSGAGGGGPISGHMVPLLPHPQSYPPGGIQAPLHSGGGGLGAQIRPKTPEGQNFVPHSGALQQQLQQVNIGDISVGTISLADLAARVKNLGFPVSCSFVIGLLERYIYPILRHGVGKLMTPLIFFLSLIPHYINHPFTLASLHQLLTKQLESYLLSFVFQSSCFFSLSPPKGTSALN